MKRRNNYLTGSVTESLRPSPAKISKTHKEASSTPSTTEEALLHLLSLFPVGAFDSTPKSQEECLPAIVLKHQLYSILSDRTTVDREVQAMCEAGRVRLFKLGVSEDDYALVLSEDYSKYVKTHLGSSPLCRKFVNSLLPACLSVSVTRQQLMGEGIRFSEEDVSNLVKKGVLLVRDVGKTQSSWWFAIPEVSSFVRSFTKGRNMVKQIIQRSKYKEIMRSELAGRKMTVSKLSMEYHIHDLIGADIVQCVQTTSGTLLRLLEPNR